MNPRPPYEYIKNYFRDGPDPQVVERLKASLREADQRIEAAQQWRYPPERKKEVRRKDLRTAGAALFGSSAVSLAWDGIFTTLICFALLGVAIYRAFRMTGPEESAQRKQVEVERQTAEKLRHETLGELEAEKEHAALRKRPGDEEMDDILRQDIDLVKERALQALSLHPDDLVRPAYLGRQDPSAFDVDTPMNSTDRRDPFVVYGPAYGEDYPVSSAVGADGKRRYGRYSVMVICTTRYHLALYRCVLDFFSGGLDEENTTEYHYNDVVAIHSVSDPNSGKRILLEPRNSQRHLFPPGTERYFEVVVSSGDRVRVVTGLSHRAASRLRSEAPDHNFVLQGRDPDFQAVADAVRMVLREKKGGVGSPGVPS